MFPPYLGELVFLLMEVPMSRFQLLILYFMHSDEWLGANSVRL